MKFRYLNFAIFFLIFAGCFFGLTLQISAQDASTSNGIPNKEPIPQPVQESLKKQEIEHLKKEYEELLKNGEEANQLSIEIADAFSRANNLSAKENTKLARLEKLVKKIRKELGGDEDAEIAETKISSVKSFIKELREITSDLFDKLKKTTPYSISAAAIQKSNAILDLIKSLKLRLK